MILNMPILSCFRIIEFIHSIQGICFIDIESDELNRKQSIKIIISNVHAEIALHLELNHFSINFWILIIPFVDSIANGNI